MYSTNLDAVLTEIARTRSTFEELRANRGPFEERARLLDRLHTLRAGAARIRSTV